jgi:hypothetical protein
MQIFKNHAIYGVFTFFLSFCLIISACPPAGAEQLPVQAPQAPKAPQVPAVQPPAIPAVKPPAAAPAGGDQTQQSAPQGTSAQLSDSAPPFRITVLEGQGAINNIKQITNRGASVLVEDENHNALSGVSVTFFLPNDGPSGLFPNGSRVLTVFTDEKGVASSRSIHFNGLVGIMPIRVVASLFSQSVETTITQTNVSSAAVMKSSFVPAAGVPRVSKGGGGSKKWLVVLVVAGAAAAGAGYYFSTRSSKPTATIGIGTITTGIPQ